MGEVPLGPRMVITPLGFCLVVLICTLTVTFWFCFSVPREGESDTCAPLNSASACQLSVFLVVPMSWKVTLLLLSQGACN